jgi:hypothetical protein
MKKKAKKSPSRLKKAIKALSLGVISYLIASAFMGPSDAEIRSKVVKLKSGMGSCSGQQVRAPSGANYILTAAHCRVLEQAGSILAITEDGREIARRIVAEDPSSDLLLLEGIPGMEGLKIGSSLDRFESVRTFTHGKGKNTYRTDGKIIQQEMVTVPVSDVLPDGTCGPMPKYTVAPGGFFGMPVCALQVVETAMDAMIVPGSSGGAVVNSSGELVGVVSAGDGAFGYIVTISDIRRFMSNY